MVQYVRFQNCCPHWFLPSSSPATTLDSTSAKPVKNPLASRCCKAPKTETIHSPHRLTWLNWCLNTEAIRLNHLSISIIKSNNISHISVAVCKMSSFFSSTAASPSSVPRILVISRDVSWLMAWQCMSKSWANVMLRTFTWQQVGCSKCLSLVSPFSRPFWSSSSRLLSTFLSFFGSSISQPVANRQHLVRGLSTWVGHLVSNQQICYGALLRQTWLPQNPLYHRPPQPQAVGYMWYRHRRHRLHRLQLANDRVP